MRYIVNPVRTDGFGAQYQSIIFTALFSHLKGMEFAYRPFSSMEHNYDNDIDFLRKKETLVNLNKNFINFSEVEESKIQIFDLKQIYFEVENNLDYCLDSEIFRKIKSLFFQNKTRLKEEKNVVSIHIRRPNRFDIGTYGYTDDQYYLDVINKIKEKNPSISKFRIYSQGREEDFGSFRNENIEYHLNESIEKTFTDLVFSDILVLSKGSFSYCAGLLSEGEVYYLPFWHKPRKTWIQI